VPVYLKSGCGRFELGIFPEPGQPGTGMVTLDCLGKGLAGKDDRAKVKDAAGKTILAGRLVHGRTAARVSGLDRLDFSVWTVTLL